MINARSPFESKARDVRVVRVHMWYDRDKLVCLCTVVKQVVRGGRVAALFDEWVWGTYVADHQQ